VEAGLPSSRHAYDSPAAAARYRWDFVSTIWPADPRQLGRSRRGDCCQRSSSIEPMPMIPTCGEQVAACSTSGLSPTFGPRLEGRDRSPSSRNTVLLYEGLCGTPQATGTPAVRAVPSIGRVPICGCMIQERISELPSSLVSSSWIKSRTSPPKVPRPLSGPILPSMSRSTRNSGACVPSLPSVFGFP